MLAITRVDVDCRPSSWYLVRVQFTLYRRRYYSCSTRRKKRALQCFNSSSVGVKTTKVPTLPMTRTNKLFHNQESKSQGRGFSSRQFEYMTRSNVYQMLLQVLEGIVILANLHAFICFPRDELTVSWPQQAHTISSEATVQSILVITIASEPGCWTGSKFLPCSNLFVEALTVHT